MRSNRLIITNNLNQTDHYPNVSMRVTSVERANEIVKSRNERYISNAIYKDSIGNFYKHNGNTFMKSAEPILAKDLLNK